MDTSITDVLSGKAPIVIEHQISFPPEKIFLSALILLGVGLLGAVLKNYLTS